MMNKVKRRLAALMTGVMIVSFIMLPPVNALAELGEAEVPGEETTMVDPAMPEEPAPGADLPGTTDTTGVDEPEEPESPATATPPEGQEDVASPGGTPQTSGTNAPVAAMVYIVRFFDWNEIQLDETQYITEGEAAVAPETPSRDGYRFTGWSEDFNSVTSDLDIHAQYVELGSYTVTINYIFANNTLALQPEVFSVAEGDSLYQTVPSPTIDGYTPDPDSIVLELDNVQQDYTYNVIYTPAGDTPYRIEHYLQDLTLTNPNNPMDPANFTLQEGDTQDLTGETGTQVTAAPVAYPGFGPPAGLPTAQIAANGSTVLRVYYTRNQYAIYYNTAGGSYVAPVSLLYGEDVPSPAQPTRAGYTFTGWSPEVPATMPAEDLNLSATWQAAGEVDYTVVYWLENITSTGYDYVGTASASGTAGASVPTQTATPTGITFPIASTRYTFNSTKTNAEKPETISGDGTTIVNKYYDRNSYLIRFTFGNKYRLTVNGATYTGAYQFTAKYGAPIDTLWPGTPTLQPGQSSDGNFIGWVGGGTNYVTRQYTLNDSIISATTFAAGWSTSTRLVTVSYNFRNLDDSAYVLGDTQQVAVQNNSNTWNSKAFTGFTATESSKTIVNNAVSFNYTRNKYSITYYNGGVIASNITGVPYEKDLSDYGYTPTRPASVPEGYAFGGWYTTPQAYEGTEYDFAGTTMPAHSLILYAHWAKPQYTVTFNPDNGDPVFTQQVYALDTATQPATPTKPGYVFGGWYQPGASLHYVFSFPVSGDVSLTARWVAQNNITYDVVYMVDGAEYDRITYGSRSVGDTVTASAITIPKYLPDALSKSLTLNASGNEIIFYYTAFEQTGYTVRYLDAASLEPLHDPKTKITSQASVTENYVNIPGYYPDFYQQTLQLGPVEEDNVITFLYTKNADAKFTVRIFQENLGGGYSLFLEYEDSAPAGSVTDITPPSYTGFTYQPDISTLHRVVASNNSTLLRLYYNRDKYTVDFTATGSGSLTGQTVFTGIQYKTTFSDAVTVPVDVAEPGYAFTGWSPALASPDALVTNDLHYTGSFERDDSQWATITLLGNGATSGVTFTDECPIGTSYTLPANPFAFLNHTFLNWDATKDGSGASYGDGDTIFITGDLTLYAQWAKNTTYGVVYLNNGGTGSVSDSRRYFDDELVELQPNSFIYPGYTFNGWLEADGSTRYGENDTFNIHRNMVFSAQWEKDNSQWADIVYDKNAEDATGAMDPEEVLVNEEHTLASNGFALQNHSFAGWNTEAGGSGDSYPDGGSITPTDGGTLTLYAQWAEDAKYSVTYDANNDSGDTQVDTEVYANVPHTILPADTFTWEHHDFVRWTTMPDGTGTTYVPDSSIYITEDLTLYAFWYARRLYKITYVDGYSTGSFKQEGYAEDDGFLDISIAENPFRRYGYDFVDWRSNRGTANPGAKMFDVNEDLVFTAEWTPINYTITYDLDGGTVNGVNPTLYNIETPSFMLVNPTRPGYRFEGWTGTTLSEESEQVVIGQSQTGDLEFTANWAYDPTQWSAITFVSEDESKGTLTGTLVYEGIVGEATSLYSAVYPQAVPEDGYEFYRWSDEIPAVFPSEDMIITAYWEDDAADWSTITFVSDDESKGTLGGTLQYRGVKGRSTDLYSVTYPQTNPEDGYEFERWSEFIPAVFPDEDMIITAYWEDDAADWSTITFVSADESMGSLDGILQYRGVKGKDTGLYSVAYPQTNPEGGYQFEGWSDEIPAVFPDEDIIITAYWEEDPTQWSTITFVSADESRGVLEGILQYRGVKGKGTGLYSVAYPQTVPEDGYEFERWSGLIPAVFPDEDMVITAYWEDDAADWSTITFVSDDESMGTLDGTLQYRGVKGKDTDLYSVTYPQTYPQDGYEFERWSELVPAVFPDEDIIITAYWEEDPDQWSTITFVSADESMGTLDGTLQYRGVKGKATNLYSVAYPQTIPEDGYQFESWSGEIPAVFPNEDSIITAYWEEDPAQWSTITFVSEDDSKGTLDGILQYRGVKGKETSLYLVAYPQTVAEDGYEFERWSELIPAAFPDEDLIITAYWEDDAADWSTITFVSADESMGALDGTLQYRGVKGKATSLYSVAYPQTTPKDGYQFGSWSDEIPDVFPDEDMIITAYWEEDPAQWSTITFVSADESMGALDGTLQYRGIKGKATDLYSVAYPQTNPEDGYEFERWSGLIPETFPDEDIVITAYWEDDDADWSTITFVSADESMGTLDGILQYRGVKGKATGLYSVAFPQTIPEDGYEFERWSGLIPETFPEEDIIITAYWEDDAADWSTITFVSDDESMGTLDGTLQYRGVKGKDTGLYSVTYPQTNPEGGYQFEGWGSEIPAVFPDEDIIITAYWEEDPAQWSTITFVSADESRGVLEGILHYRGVKGKATSLYSVAYPQTVAEDGYEFERWSEPIPTDFPEEDMIITAYWEDDAADWSTITFVSADESMGTLGGTLQYRGVKGKATGLYSVAYPQTNPEDGYEFERWSGLIPETFPDEDIIITAYWEDDAADWSTITFVSADESMGTLDGILQYRGVKGRATDLHSLVYPQINPKNGYRFKNWDETIPAVFPEEDSIITAYWEEDPAQWSTITFVSEDDSKGTLDGLLQYRGIKGEAISLSRMVSVTYPQANPAAGYKFSSWSDEIPLTFPEQDMIITAYFIPEQTTPSTPSPSTPGAQSSASSGTDSGSGTVSENAPASDGGASGAGRTGSQSASGNGGVRTGDTGTPWVFLWILLPVAAILGLIVVRKNRVR